MVGTDGDFNVGLTGHDQLSEMVRRGKDDGIHMTVLGVGYGNLDDSLLAVLGRESGGSYHYIDSLTEARRVLVEDLGGVLSVAGVDVKTQVEFNPAAVSGYRLVGYEDRLLDAEDFLDDSVRASDLGAGQAVTAIYEIAPAGTALPGSRAVERRYPPAGAAGAAPAASGSDGLEAELFEVRVRYKPSVGAASVDARAVQAVPVGDPPAPSADFSFALAAATFGKLLRSSEHAGRAGYDDVLALARAGRGPDPGGERAEFARLVEVAAGLWKTE